MVHLRREDNEPAGELLRILRRSARCCNRLKAQGFGRPVRASRFDLLPSSPHSASAPPALECGECLLHSGKSDLIFRYYRSMPVLLNANERQQLERLLRDRLEELRGRYHAEGSREAKAEYARALKEFTDLVLRHKPPTTPGKAA